MALWKKLSSKTLLDHPRLTVLEDQVLMQNGQQTDYIRYANHSDWATPIAINTQGKFLLIREHAYPVNEILLQFPEGDTKKGETLEAAVNRELQEETGYRSHTITAIGQSLKDHRRSETRNVVMLLEDLERAEVIDGDPEELHMEVVWLTEDEVWASIRSGEIIQKNTLTAWAIYQAWKR